MEPSSGSPVNRAILEGDCRWFVKKLGMPVHRLEDSPGVRVFAYEDEIDRWIEETLNRHLPGEDIEAPSVDEGAGGRGRSRTPRFDLPASVERFL